MENKVKVPKCDCRCVRHLCNKKPEEHAWDEHESHCSWKTHPVSKAQYFLAYVNNDTENFNFRKFLERGWDEAFGAQELTYVSAGVVQELLDLIEVQEP